MFDHIKEPCCKCGKPSLRMEIIWNHKIPPHVVRVIHICKPCVIERRKEIPHETKVSFEDWLQEPC